MKENKPKRHRNGNIGQVLKMKKYIMMILIAVIIIIAYIANTPFKASAVDIIDAVDIYTQELREMERVIDGADTAFDVNMASIFRDAIAGDLDLSPGGIMNSFLRLLFSEVFENAALLRNLLIIGIISAILHNITSSFENSAIGEIGFYVSYLAMVSMLFSSFRIAVSVFSDLMMTVSMFIEAGIPLFISLVIMSGNVAGATVFNSVLMFAVVFVGRFISWGIGPAIMSAAALNMVNFIDEKDMLTKLAELIKKVISWILKVLAISIVSIISIQRISTPLANNLFMRAARSAVNTVPVVGSVLTGALENVMYLARLLRGGVLVVVIITMIAICLMPMLKLLALILTYKVAAALIQPICDDRIVDCLEAAADYTALLLSAAVIVSMMFLVSVIIMLTI